MGHDPDCAIRLAWWRLRFPVELAEKGEAQYRAYLALRCGDTARWLLRERDASGLRFLFSVGAEPDKALLGELCEQARMADAAECLAVLLEEQHRRFPSGFEKSFDL